MALIERAWADRGPLAIFLLPLSAIYAILIAAQRLSFRLGWKRVSTLDVPVVVVGNLIAGGAGKTPTVIAIATLLTRAGWRPGIVSRGYGRVGDEIVEVQASSSATVAGDEPLLMRRRLGLPVVVGRDRVAAARRLRSLHPDVDIILSDDGLQHTRLGRDVEVVVFDERGVGNGWLLPAGPLRETFSTRGSSMIVLYNAPAPTTPWPGFLATRQLSGAVLLSDWLAGAPASTAALDALIGQTIVAVAGTARPERFFGMLRDVGLTIVPTPLPDHDRFDSLPWPDDTPQVIVTEKDAVKLTGRDTGTTLIWVAPLDFSPEPAFSGALLKALSQRAARPT